MAGQRPDVIGYRLRRFVAAWREEDSRVQAFLAWNAANTLTAFALLFSSFFLLVLVSAPGYQRSLLLAYIGIAVVWLLSVFLIGPVYEWVVPSEERE